MLQVEEIIMLYDYYGELLSDSQKKYFTEYYFENLTLSEISENNNVSRNAVSKELKLTQEKLLKYEEKLKILEKDKSIRNLINKIDNETLRNEFNKILDE